MNRLINISEATTIAIHSLALIGQEKRQLSANEIAEKTSFSKNHLSKVLQLLVKQDYLKSVRGPKGGFSLKLPSNEISLLEVYEIFEGRIQDVFCHNNSSEYQFEDCIYGDIIDGLTKKFKKSFSDRKISDVKMIKK